jgi:hypothetical protein
MNIPPAISILKSMNPIFLASIGAKNIQVSSTRSIRFDLPANKANDGINRVKITNINGKAQIQFLKIEEIDLLGGVELDSINQAIKNFTGITA